MMPGADTYLNLMPDARHEEIKRLLAKNQEFLRSSKKGVQRYRIPAESVAHLQAQFLDCCGDVVRIGCEDELSAADREKVELALRSFMPWRKGPFEVFGIEIDAEWRSERKWRRVLPALPDLEDKIIADIGCNNGYYMFRLTPHRPRLVLGFDPYLQHYFTFRTLNGFAGLKNLHYELLGVEHIPLFKNSFDVVFLMGVIYHRSSPLEVLRDIKTSLKPGGVLIIESQAIPGEAEMALFPKNRYAKAPGIFFVPTGACLRNWMIRAGFQDVEIFCSHAMSSQEQRRTAWMDFESFQDFIDPKNTSLTVEGYPAPVRVYLKGIA